MKKIENLSIDDLIKKIVDKVKELFKDDIEKLTIIEKTIPRLEASFEDDKTKIECISFKCSDEICIYPNALMFYPYRGTIKTLYEYNDYDEFLNL